MSGQFSVPILPYSLIVGQEQLKLALELAYIAPRIGGVLISGQRGTGKSTAARAFAQMMYNRLPVTLPINATEDRVVGGWMIDELLRGEAKEQPGLLEEANGSLLYVDEINLLDDHIVNIILDVTSTGVLVVQREGRRDQKPVSFTLVGTMNPEEGGLRPQLLDRFGLMVSVTAEIDKEKRSEILQTIFDFDEAVFRLTNKESSPFINSGREKDKKHRLTIERARKNFYNVKFPKKIAQSCATLAANFQAEGHRGDYVMALAARAYAALQGDSVVKNKHVEAVASFSLQHRRPDEAIHLDRKLWRPEDDERVKKILTNE